MKTTIEVKQHHIDIAKAKRSQRNATSCPIARAMREQKIHFYGVSQEGIEVNRNLENPLPLPEQAITFIQDFDEGKKVKPFSFEVNIPEQYLS